MAKQQKRTHLRFRKNDPAHNLMAAVQHWVKANGGDLIVIGGIETQTMPGDTYRFKVAIGCTGRRPEKAAAV
jgi:hypothetical protein